MKKENRQSLIKEIITAEKIESQQQLLEELFKRGVKATQATISRDINELRIVKKNDENGNVIYGILTERIELENDSHLQEVFNDSVLQITQVQFMNVVKTLLGTADIVAAEIDELGLSEIVGTLAGTDTIVLISKSESEARQINNQLSAYLN